MKISEELKTEFGKLCLKPDMTLIRALNIVQYSQWSKENEYPELAKFLFGNDTSEKDNRNQIQFAKWWSCEEEV